MADRSWYMVSAGEREGPFADEAFAALIAAGRVTADTLVWSEGMTDWQRAGDVPGLIPAAAPPPPPQMPPPAPLPGSAQWVAANANTPGAPITADFGVFGLFGWVLLLAIGNLLIVPAPWVATAFYRWTISHLKVPQMPALQFAGRPGDIWWVFILVGLLSYAGLPEALSHAKQHVHLLPILLLPIEAALGWLILRWVVANVASAGQPPALRFEGGLVGYIGWSLLLYISFITIIGWAWVVTAWMRWIARNVQGAPGPVVFRATGWGILWRTIAFGLGSIFIIPIPWLLHWYARWYISQFAIAARS